jgi:hypothetical protein
MDDKFSRKIMGFGPKLKAIGKIKIFLHLSDSYQKE